MTDEERQRAMDFIVAQQAKNSVEIEKLIESHRKAEQRLDRTEIRFDRDERILKLMIRAGRLVRQEMRQQHQQFLDEIKVMKEFQAHSDRRLDALIDIVRAERNGRSS
jgi:multidrug resistance efflux pump